MILNVKRCLYTVDVFFLDFLRMKKLELPNPVIVFTVRLTGPAGVKHHKPKPSLGHAILTPNQPVNAACLVNKQQIPI
jgi:hypothetical protein